MDNINNISIIIIIITIIIIKTSGPTIGKASPPSLGYNLQYVLLPLYKPPGGGGGGEDLTID